MKKTKINIIEVARKAKVSPTTISLILNNKYQGHINEKNYKRVKEVIERLNYQPCQIARSLRTGNTGIIGFFFSMDMKQVFTHNYFLESILAVEEAAALRGFQIFFTTLNNRYGSDESFRKIFDFSFVDGWLTACPPPIGHSSLQNINNCKQPIISIGNHPEYTNVSWVGVDEFKSAFDITSHLIKIKKDKIAFVCGLPIYPFVSERLRGYREALKHYGIDFDKDLVVETDFSPENTENAVRCLLQMKDKPNAILSIRDLPAISILKVIKASGYDVPRDIAIACFNDSSLVAESNPSITAVKSPVKKLAETATSLLIEKITKGNSFRIPEKIIMDSEIIVRESTDLKYTAVNK